MFDAGIRYSCLLEDYALQLNKRDVLMLLQFPTIPTFRDRTKTLLAHLPQPGEDQRSPGRSIKFELSDLENSGHEKHMDNYIFSPNSSKF
jgi:hypothetical protein